MEQTQNAAQADTEPKWEFVLTGGGMNAMRLDLPGNNWYVLVTDAEDWSHYPGGDESALVGLYPMDPKTLEDILCDEGCMDKVVLSGGVWTWNDLRAAAYKMAEGRKPVDVSP